MHAGIKFRNMNNAACENFTPYQISCNSNFLAFSALLFSGLRSAMLSLARILRAWIDSTILA